MVPRVINSSQRLSYLWGGFFVCAPEAQEEKHETDDRTYVQNPGDGRQNKGAPVDNGPFSGGDGEEDRRIS